MGCRKRNTTLWYQNNFVGTELNQDFSYAKIAEGCGLKGVQVWSMEELTNELRLSCDEQKKVLQHLLKLSLIRNLVSLLEGTQ